MIFINKSLYLKTLQSKKTVNLIVLKLVLICKSIIKTVSSNLIVFKIVLISKWLWGQEKNVEIRKINNG